MSQQQIAFKVFFQDEIRRVGFPSPSPSLAELRTLLKTIFGNRFHDELAIQYTDEDNDRITVSTDIEWAEALRSMDGQSPKKIHIVANKLGGFFKDGPAPQPRFFYDAAKDKKKLGKKNGKKSAEADSAAHSCVHKKKGLKKLRKAVPEGLEMLFDGGKILPHNIPEYLQSALRVNVVSEGSANQEEIVDLDVDIHRLLSALFRRSINLLDEKNYAEARRVIHAYLKIDPKSPLALYNLACTEALDSKPKTACKKLAKAVKNGYNNLAHLLADSDLDSIRLMPEYLQVVDALRKADPTSSSSEEESKKEDEQDAQVKEESKPVQEDESWVVVPASEPVEVVAASVVEAESVPVPAPAPEAVASPAPIEFENEMRLLEEMGFGDQEKNLELLKAQNGDLASVIALLFE